MYIHHLWYIVALLLPCIAHGTRAPGLHKQEAHVIRKTVQASEKSMLHIHNDRGSVHVSTAHVTKPTLEVHVYGPEGYTQYVDIVQNTHGKHAPVYAQIQDIPQNDDQETGKKSRSHPTLSQFTCDYYVTLPSQTGIQIESHDTLYTVIYGVNGHIAVEGDTATAYIEQAGSSVTANVNKGDITVDTARGYVDAHTYSGHLSLANIHADTNASAYGQLSARNMHGNVCVSNQRGHMYISDVQAVLNAHTRDGITVTQHSLSPEINVFIEARHTASIYLPEQVNAYIYAKTVKGIVTSEIPITLDPVTTRLSRDIWKQMHKQVKGTFGHGGAYINVDATNQIRLYALSS